MTLTMTKSTHVFPFYLLLVPFFFIPLQVTTDQLVAIPVNAPELELGTEAAGSSTITTTVTIMITMMIRQFFPPDEDETHALHRLRASDTHLAAIRRIRIKSLHRRARARHQLGSWTSLTGAEEDYTLLLSLLSGPSSPTTRQQQQQPQALAPREIQTIRAALAQLPAEITKTKEKEMGEMMGSLKELGNKILGPFGLSTDNFKMVKDERTGGYSMNFEQGGK